MSAPSSKAMNAIDRPSHRQPALTAYMASTMAKTWQKSVNKRSQTGIGRKARLNCNCRACLCRRRITLSMSPGIRIKERTFNSDSTPSSDRFGGSGPDADGHGLVEGGRQLRQPCGHIRKAAFEEARAQPVVQTQDEHTGDSMWQELP